MFYDTHPFRIRYRETISLRYNAWTHAITVLVIDAVALAFFLSRLSAVSSWEWLVVPAGLVFHNVVEYVVHKEVGHEKRRYGGLFYKRHTGDHHSFFAPGQMTYDFMRDWRVILFPTWLILVLLVLVTAVWFVLSLWNPNIASLFVASQIGGYMAYEILHASEHLLEDHPVSRLPWIRHMRRLHELHHRHDLMASDNFNIVFP